MWILETLPFPTDLPASSSGQWSWALRGFHSPAWGRGHCNHLAAVTAAVPGLPARATVHQRPRVQPLPRHCPRSGCPPAFAPLTHAPAPSPSPALVLRPASAACPTSGLGTYPPSAQLLPPSCQGGTGTAPLASASGGRSICWGIQAGMEVPIWPLHSLVKRRQSQPCSMPA